ncbi:hypothetical protein [Paraburkholderia susongensis]|uniref:Uncharacterized protein n=1 Tax=Paraburkholderia susongensis TaxID=1515439 RepID=A0A1X7LQT5_9BURK|nr:hypothetical protein [Paraburkholderia susongensis]SMG56251.1 hypothetical protein SAMN06265784_108109 [Paraburkholderia susongensis]
MEQQKQDDAGGKEECLLCRVTYSIFSTFPPMPSAMALNIETDEFFPLDTLRSYSTGYEMADAQGYAWACNCRERASNRFDEQFTLRDATGKQLARIRYRLRIGSRVVAKGVTDSVGRTQRISTGDAKRLSIDVATS